MRATSSWHHGNPGRDPIHAPGPPAFRWEGQEALSLRSYVGLNLVFGPLQCAVIKLCLTAPKRVILPLRCGSATFAAPAVQDCGHQDDRALGDQFSRVINPKDRHHHKQQGE